MSTLAPGDTAPLKDPDSVLPYVMDWRAWLVAAEIASSTWEITTAPDDDLEIDSDDIPAGDQTARVFLSGGTVGKKYVLTNHIITNETPAREDDRSFKVKIKER